MSINARARNVLGQVIQLHYTTCEPVGSKLISNTRVVPFSPATIRNIMNRLEDSGHLQQPHISAGRLPTDLGYRTYVDGIRLDSAPLQEDDKSMVDRVIDETPVGPTLLRMVAEIIHQRTGQMTFYLPLRQSGVRLRHLHLERLNRRNLLVLWIARGGQTFETVLTIDDEDLGGAVTEKTANYINNAFRGCSLLDIKRALNRDSADLLLNKTALLTELLLNEAGQLDDISFQGLSDMLEMPEFQNVQSVKDLIDVVDKKQMVQRVIRDALERESWISFYIGAEMADQALHNLTIALGKISQGETCIGCVGVVGPKRMPYLKSLQMLRYARERVVGMSA